MRHERSAHASGVEQMFFEGESNYFRVCNKEGQPIDISNSSKSYAVIKGNKVIVHRHIDPGLFGLGDVPGFRPPKVYSLENVSVEGTIQFEKD